MDLDRVRNENMFPRDNCEQTIGEKFTKLCKIGFSKKSFIADVLQFFTKASQKLPFVWTVGYSTSYSTISGIFLEFNNLLRP